MKLSKLVPIAVALLGLGAAPARAAAIDYFMTVPLFEAGASSDVSDLTLRGTLTYDGDDAMTGHGSFAIGDDPAVDFAGLTFLMDLSSGATQSLGVLFDGEGADGASLYMNFATGVASVGGTINYCAANSCAFYNTAGATFGLAATLPEGVPSMPGSGVGVGVSPVPLPPAVGLFGGGLLMLAGAAALRRSRLQAVRA